MDKNIQKIKPSGIFTNYIYKAIPLAFDESMSYYETLCGILSLLKTQEDVINNNADLLAELELYVQNYFKNLDVQTEINNKLDEMAESGQLTDIIAQYLELAGVLSFNTINDMKNATNINNGSTCKTLGQDNFNDGLGRFYKIRNITNTDVIDNINIIPITTNNNLIAELITEKYINDIGNLNNLDTSDKSNLVGAINEIKNASNPNFNDVIPFFAILRPTSTGWILLSDDDHIPFNVQNINVDEQGRLVLTHNNASKIYSFSICSDETFAKYNIHAGASVGKNLSLISIFINTTAIAYFRYNKSQISIDSKFSNLVKSVEWNGSTNKMEINFDDNLRSHYMSNWKVNVNDASLNNNYDYFCTWEDSLKLSVVAYDKETHTAQPLSGAYDRLMVSADFEGFINANDLISYPISGANFWVTGWLKK